MSDSAVGTAETRESLARGAAQQPVLRAGPRVIRHKHTGFALCGRRESVFKGMIHDIMRFKHSTLTQGHTRVETSDTNRNAAAARHDRYDGDVTTNVKRDVNIFVCKVCAPDHPVLFGTRTHSHTAQCHRNAQRPR